MQLQEKELNCVVLPSSAKSRRHCWPAHLTCLPPSLCVLLQVAVGQRFKKVNWLRAGILSADKVLTVSPNYAMEISSGERWQGGHVTGRERDGCIGAV